MVGLPTGIVVAASAHAVGPTRAVMLPKGTRGKILSILGAEYLFLVGTVGYHVRKEDIEVIDGR